MKRLLWLDAEANCRRLADQESVADIVRKAANAGIDTLIVDVKPLGGEVLYLSELAPRLGEVEGFSYPKDFDLLAATIEEGHSAGLEVHAALNVFSEGHREWERGPAYEHEDWQACMYEADRSVRFGGGEPIQIEAMDPWDRAMTAAAYTRKSGQTISIDKRCAVISSDVVTAVVEPGVEIAIPTDGCVIALKDNQLCSPGDSVVFEAQAAFRSAVESKVPSFGIFVNPIGLAREYELRVIDELASNYDLDGITFDRMRYPNLYADFSDVSRSAFQAWLGKGQIQWPGDVFTISELPWKLPVPGRFYKEWLEWRAWQIKEFAEDAAGVVRSRNTRARVGIYVGSWYESYYDVGVNWGSDSFNPEYSWMTPKYNRTGYAQLFDYICTGCYYPIITRAEARLLKKPEGATVEAACDLSMRAIDGAASVFGSLYLKDYAGNPAVFREGIRMAMARTDGVMFFDLVYLEDYGWWQEIEGVFRT